MEGLIFDIKHYALHDGPGIRQTVFFKGCPLSCWWCHNPESQLPEVETYTRVKSLDNQTFRREETIGYSIGADDLIKTIQSDTIFYDESGGGVTFSGGEPLMQPEFLREMASRSKDASIHTALDTSGYAPQKVLLEILPFIDLVLYDIKIMDDALHQKYTGVSNRPILENLEMLIESGKEVRLRFPVIPGITDTDKNLREIKNYLAPFNRIKHIDLLSYHDISRGKYKRFGKDDKMGSQKLQEGSLDRIQKQFESLGFQTQVGG
jgi:pyruvate formate lyase activating enzyme